MQLIPPEGAVAGGIRIPPIRCCNRRNTITLNCNTCWLISHQPWSVVVYGRQRY